MEEKSIGGYKTIGKLLYFHLAVVFAQFGIRWYADLTIVRDFFIFLILWVALSSSLGYKKDKLSKSVILLLIYGVVMMLVHSVSGTGFISSLAEFRNYFFPFFLMLPLSVYFTRAQNREHFVNFIYVLFIILLIDVYFEGLLEMLGVSRDFLPWYQYQYIHSVRFITSENPIDRAIYPENAPVLGLLGWANATACTLVALYAFLAPFIFTGSIRDNTKLGRKSNTNKIFIVIAVIGALVILEIKTPMFAFLVASFILMLRSNKKVAMNLMAAFVAVAIVAYLTKGLWMDTFSFLVEESTGDEGAISYVFSIATLSSVFSSFIGSSFLSVLFGGDFTGLSYYENIEIRILTFTMQLGVIWLISFLYVCFSTVKESLKINKVEYLTLVDRRLNLGVLLMLLVYFIDMLHYSYLMYLFNINLFAVCIALIVGLNSSFKNKNIYVS